jgi:uncharacterized protein (TIGR00251 family)
MVLALHVQPGARRTQIVGQHGERLKIALQAPPVDGRANEALVKYLAQRLGLKRGELRIVAGMSSRDKSVAIDATEGLQAQIVARLGETPPA